MLPLLNVFWTDLLAFIGVSCVSVPVVLALCGWIYGWLFPNKCDFIQLLIRPWQTPQKYVQNIWPNVCEWLCMHIGRLNLSIAMMFFWKILQIPARLPEMVGGTIYIGTPLFFGGRNETWISWISVDILLTPIHWPNRTRPSTFWPEVKGHRRHGASQCQKKEQVEDAWSWFYPVKNRAYCIPEWFIYQTKMVPGICWNMSPGICRGNAMWQPIQWA